MRVSALDVLLLLTTLPCSIQCRAEYCLTSLGLLRRNEKGTSQLINETAIWDQIRNPGSLAGFIASLGKVQEEELCICAQMGFAPAHSPLPLLNLPEPPMPGPPF